MPAHNPWYTPGLANVLQPGVALGHITYVNGLVGNDSSNGRNPDHAKLTIAGALTDCLDDRNDVVVILAYHETTPTDTFPVTISTDQTHIIGASYPHIEADRMVTLLADQDTAIFDVQAQWCEIAGLKMSGGVSHGCIEFTGTGGVVNKGCAIHHNQFAEKYGAGGQPLHGVWIGPTQSDGKANWSWIAYNKFYPSITGYGINVESNPAYLVIHNNLFICVADIAIYVAHVSSYGEITDNKFSLDTDVVGRAITFTAGATGNPWWIDGNSANDGAVIIAANPYRDLSGMDHNFGMNFQGNTMVMPSVV